MLTDKLKTEIMCYTTDERFPGVRTHCWAVTDQWRFFGDVMSMDKAIQHGKEWRKPYRGSKTIDYTCRNHGTCYWCKSNRQFKFRDKKPREKEWQTKNWMNCLKNSFSDGKRKRAVTRPFPLHRQSSFGSLPGTRCSEFYQAVSMLLWTQLHVSVWSGNQRWWDLLYPTLRYIFSLLPLPCQNNTIPIHCWQVHISVVLLISVKGE